MRINVKSLEYGAEVKACSRTDEHTPECDGNCEVIKMTDLQVDLHNEALEWTKRDMVIAGVPRALAGAAPGIDVEIFELECRFAGLIQYLKESMPDFDITKANEAYQKVMLDKLRGIRKIADEQRGADIAVAQTRLLGPDGEVLH